MLFNQFHPNIKASFDYVTTLCCITIRSKPCCASLLLSHSMQLQLCLVLRTSYYGMLCYVMLCCAVLYCTVLYCAVLYCTALHCAMLCCVVLCCVVGCAAKLTNFTWLKHNALLNTKISILFILPKRYFHLIPSHITHQYCVTLTLTLTLTFALPFQWK